MNNTCFLAIDAGGTFLKGALFSGKGTLLKESFLSVPVDSQGELEKIRTSYQALVLQEINQSYRMGLEIKGIGICIPGPFDYREGICRMSHKYPAIYGIPLRPWFDELLAGIKVTFLHDSEAFLKGAIRQDQVHYHMAAGVIIGTGLGFAVAQDSRILRNSSGGPRISIFQKQYLDEMAEEYVSKRGIIKRYQMLCSPSGSKEVCEIAEAAKDGEAAAVQAFQETGTHLAAILYDVIKENDLECLYLGGAISKSAELFLPGLREGLAGLPGLKAIKKAEDIDNAPLYGIFSSFEDTPECEGKER